MIVVVLIGILAAVVIPNWTSTSRNKKYDPEISAMMTEISTREQQYKQENNKFLDAPTCPTNPQPNGADFNVGCVTTGSAWASLRVNATDSAIRCNYTVTTGLAGTTPAAPTACTAPSMTLAESWFYIVANCDMDGKGGTNAQFCMSSWNTKVGNTGYGK